MKNISREQGLTLTELIVASMLIAIVLLGVVAFNISLTQIQNNSLNQSTLSTQASTAMNYLNDDIAMATGTSVKSGILTHLYSSYSSLCLRQPDATPMDLDNNPWMCYLWDYSTKNLKRCVPVDVNSSSVACNTTFPVMNLTKLENGSFFEVNTPAKGLIRITLKAQDGTDYYIMTSDIETKNHTY